MEIVGPIVTCYLFDDYNFYSKKMEVNRDSLLINYNTNDTLESLFAFFLIEKLKFDYGVVES